MSLTFPRGKQSASDPPLRPEWAGKQPTHQANDGCVPPAPGCVRLLSEVTTWDKQAPWASTFGRVRGRPLPSAAIAVAPVISGAEPVALLRALRLRGGHAAPPSPLGCRVVFVCLSPWRGTASVSCRPSSLAPRGRKPKCVFLTFEGCSLSFYDVFTGRGMTPGWGRGPRARGVDRA